MATTPRGMSIQEAYRLFREGKLVVNRKYQRKLVWTEEEKSKLIDSILNGFPIPLILLAVQNQTATDATYEIIDGVQRLHAISSFIENEFCLDDGQYFNINTFPRAKQAAESGLFFFNPLMSMLSDDSCVNFLDYQLAVTIYPTSDPNLVTEVFGRINSGGRQLSPQERRQAGVVTPFAELVRKIASELRGDTSPEIVMLSDMPQISIGSKLTNQRYGLKAEDTFWVQQGIFWAASLRSSQDEEMIADIAASILFGIPFNKSLEELDDLYNPAKELHRKVENALAAYGTERLSVEIKSTFAIIKETIISFSKEPNALRKVISGIRNELITPFYAIFMAFFDLVVRQEMSPSDTNKIVNAIKGLSKDMVRSRHYTTTPDREKNIHKTIGLIQPFFAKKEPPVLRHGPGLSLDFENSLRRSRIETSRYEFKQGILQLGSERKIDEGVFIQIINTVCGIANIGPDAGGYIFIGVAGKSQDAKRISEIDNIFPYDVNEHSIVGIDRELMHINCSLEQYMNKFLDKIRFSKLSEPLKTQVLSHVDIVQYRGFHVIRIVIPAQKQPSSIGEKVYLREGANTIEATAQKAMALSHLFNKGIS